MESVAFRLIAGRYHATPWGRHVNEGAVEWPPSPWRLLRALVATWKRTLPDVSTADVLPILRAIAQPPEFVLPPATTAHTRHFMPWFKKGPADRTKVFDAFVVLAKEARVLVRWPEVVLDDAQSELLGRILRNLATIGRSESWCEASIARDDDATSGLLCRPLEGVAPPEHEVVRLLCAHPQTSFADDHVTAVTTTSEGRGRNKRTIEHRTSPYDPPWNLCMETRQLHAERWSDPPGSRWVLYARPRDCFKMAPLSAVRVRRLPERSVEVVRYALDSTVLPLATETLPVAEAARRALMGIHGRLTESAGVRGRSMLLSGKRDDGDALVGHPHAYYLPSDDDGDGRLDHLTVVARGGFGRDEVVACDRLESLQSYRAGEGHDVRVLLLELGRLGHIQSGRALRPSTVWESATPYIATRFARTRGKDRCDLGSPAERLRFLTGDLRSQLQQVLGVDAEDVLIEPLADEHGVFRLGHRWRPLEFARYRRKASDDGGRRLAGAFRLRFGAPIAGPIALGHSAHFGMGLFLAASTAVQGSALDAD